MSSAYLVPTEDSVKDKLKFLYGDDLEVTDGEAPNADQAICAVYVSKEGEPVAAALCDTNFGAYAGASLSMIPAAGAQDAAASGELSAGMMDNLHEVMNICANLLMNDSTPHLRLEDVYASLADAPEAARELLQNAQGPAFKVDIPRYGSGQITLLS